MADEIIKIKETLIKIVNEDDNLRNDIEDVIQSTAATYRVIYSDGHKIETPRRFLDDLSEHSNYQALRELKLLLLKKSG